VRVALVTEGTYPYERGGVATWCEQLITGLPDHEFDVVAIVAHPFQRVVYSLPPNVRRLRPVPLWGILSYVDERLDLSGRERRSRRRRSQAAAVEAGFVPAWARLTREMLSAEPSPARLHDLFLDLHEFLERHDPDRTFACKAVYQAFADEWQAAAPAHARPTIRDVIEVVHVLRRLLSVLALPPLEADVVHGTAAGVSSLLGVVTKARKDTRFVLTEHGVYVREAFIAQAKPSVSSAVRHVLGRFAVGTAMAAYLSADEVLPVAEFNKRWEVALATDPAKIRVVYNGVDPVTHRPMPFPQGRPTLVSVGRIDPLKDLKTMIEAAAIVRAECPDVLVDIYGPVPHGNERYLDELLALRAELGLEDTVRFLGPTKDVAGAYATGHVVLVTSISEGFPFAVVEAMMNARPVVATGIGGIPEALADTGLIVEARSPDQVALACLGLLRDLGKAEQLGAAARARALDNFTMSRFLFSYRQIYARALA
jgi:glycosyltransferase involved in cell wall biosynthesis